jgi:hypothetical protein
MGHSGVKIDKQDIIDAIIKSEGILNHAAIKLGCSRSVFYVWIDNDPEIAEVVKKAREQAYRDRVDMDEEIKKKAYSSAIALLDKCDPTFTIFTMKAKCNWNQGVTEQNITINTVERPYSDYVIPDPS